MSVLENMMFECFVFSFFLRAASMHCLQFLELIFATCMCIVLTHSSTRSLPLPAPFCNASTRSQRFCAQASSMNLEHRAKK